MKRFMKPVLAFLCILCMIVPMTAPMVSTRTVYAAEISVPAKPHKIANVVIGVHVYWKAVDGAEKYGVWRSETGKDGTYKWLGNPVKTDFTDTKVKSGTTYFYKITAMDPVTGEHSEMSAPIGITYVATPDISKRANTEEGIYLEWEEIKGAKGYAIYRKSYAGSDAWARIATIEDPDTLEYTDISVADNNGKEYRYTIRALAGADLKTLSGCRNTGRSMVRLSSRTLSVLETGVNSIKCSWNTTKFASGYEIMTMDEDGNEKTFTVGNYKTGTKTFTGLEPETSYLVKVRSYKKLGDAGTYYSAWSDGELAETKAEAAPSPTATPKPTATPIPKPTSAPSESEVEVPAKPYKITNVVSGVHVYWRAVEGATKYGVWRSETGKDGAYKWLGNPKDIHFTDTKAESGKTYYYKITAMDSEAVHSDKSEALGITYVATPDITKRSNTTGGIALEWNKISGATGYAVYRKLYGSSDDWARVVTVEGNGNTGWTDAGVIENNGTVYQYTVRALAGSKMNTLSGCRSNGRTIARLVETYFTTLDGAEESVTCYFKTDENATGYEVRITNNDGSYDKTIKIDDNTTDNCTFDGLQSATEYGCEIRTYKAVEGIGNFYSQWSNRISVCTEGVVLETEDWFQWKELEDGTIAITGINYANFQSGVDVYVPATIDGKQVTTIASSALAYSGSDNTSLILPEGLTTIDSWAMQGAYYDSIYIPSTVSYIGENAFINCSNLLEISVSSASEFFAVENKVLYSKDYKQLVLVFGEHPYSSFSVRNGVESILNGACVGYSVFEEVNIPASVISIAYDAFSNCCNLSTINVDKENTAFNSFESYVLSEDGTALVFVAPATKELEIPSSVTEIDPLVFTTVPELNSITVESGNSVFSAKDGVLFLDNETTLFCYPANRRHNAYTVPETVVKIGEYAFERCINLETVELPDGLTAIGDYAFQNSGKLSGITLPDSVYIVGFGVFSGCTRLTEVTLSKNMTEIPMMMFMMCSSLKEVIIPNNVTRIDYTAFSGCFDLERAVIPGNVTFIAPGAFDKWNTGCELTIYAPEGSYAEQWAKDNGYSTEIFDEEETPDDTEVGETEDWFTWIELTDGTVAITGINYDNFQSGEVVEIPAKINGKKVTSLSGWSLCYSGWGCTELILPEGLLRIESGALQGANYQIIRIPSTVEYIAGSAFAYCQNLSDVTISEKNEHYVIIDGVLYNTDKTTLLQVLLKNQPSSFQVPDTVKRIEEVAFSGRLEIEEVKIPASVEYISSSAFNSCNNITSIIVDEANTSYNSYDGYVLSEDNTEIRFVAPGATELKIPATVKEADAVVLLYARSLGNVTVEEGNTNFYAEDGVLFNDDKSTLILYPEGKQETSYTVPESVVSIEMHAFDGAKNLQSITLPENLTKIGQMAFQSCSSLTEIAIPDSVTSIGMYAFSGCSLLETIAIPDGVSRIEDSTFISCNNLIAIEIPASVEYIDMQAFDYSWDDSRTVVIRTPEGSYAEQWAKDNGYSTEVLEEEEKPDDDDTENWFQWKELADGTLAITGTNYPYFQAQEVIKVPATINDKQVTVISGWSLSYSGFGCKELVLPEGLTTIESASLQGCQYEKIYIPSTVTTIGDSAFAYSTNLAEIIVDKANASYVYEDGVLYSKDGTELLYVSPVTCKNSFDVPDAVVSIKANAFLDCIALEKISLPASVKEINWNAFNGCTSLKTIEIDEENKVFNSYGTYVLSEDDSVLVCVVPATTALEIPASVTEIDLLSLSYATALTTITVEEGNTAYCEEAGVLFNSDKTALLLYPDNLEDTSYVMPETVTVVAEYAFHNCKNLETVNLSEALTKIGGNAFWGCQSLKGIVIPDSVNSIGIGAFASCGALTAVTLPQNLTALEGMVFMSCGSLESIIIPDGVKDIYFMAFAGCFDLALIEIPESVTSIASDAFNNWGTDSNLTIRAAEDSYAAEWAEQNGFAVELIGDDETVEEACFYWEENEDGTVTITEYQGDETSIVVPETIEGKTVTKIGADCFSFDGEELVSVELPNTIICIDEYAFMWCENLQEINIPDSVTYIGEAAFSDCYSLQKIEIPNSVTYIGDCAFDYCESLTELYLPAGVKYFYADVEEYDNGLEVYQYSMYGLCSLKEITVDAANPSYASVNGILYSKDMTQLIDVPEAYEGVVTIADTVTDMNLWSTDPFVDCRNITEIVLPKDMQYFNNYVSGCENLKQYTVAEGNQYYTTVDGALYDSTKTKLISVPVASIGSTYYAIPDGVISVDYYAFESCYSVETIYIPASVELLGSSRGEYRKYRDEEYENIYTNIFMGCTYLTGITVAEDNQYYKSEDGVVFSKDGTVLVAYPRGKYDESYSVPEGVTEIGSRAFYLNRDLRTISLPASLEVLQPYAFQSTDIETINFSEGLKIIGTYAFITNHGLTEIVLPDSVERIDSFAFSGCSFLENIELSDNLTYIGRGAFRTCKELTSICIPEGVIEIPEGTFTSCRNLMEIQLPSTVIYIEASAFYGCRYLTTVYAPAGSYAEAWARENGYGVINF